MSVCVRNGKASLKRVEIDAMTPYILADSMAVKMRSSDISGQRKIRRGLANGFFAGLSCSLTPAYLRPRTGNIGRQNPWGFILLSATIARSVSGRILQ